MSKINLQRGKLAVENRKSRERKRICSEVSEQGYGTRMDVANAGDELLRRNHCNYTPATGSNCTPA